MLNINDFIITAKLNNGKQIVLDPDYNERKVHYRFMSEQEVKSGQLNLVEKHIWTTRPLYRTTDPMTSHTVIFADIQGTAIVLQRI